MTRTNSVTQCPKCGTAFHVGSEQLDAANGRVRCGSCLEVFQANEHFIVEQKQLFDSNLAFSAPEKENTTHSPISTPSDQPTETEVEKTAEIETPEGSASSEQQVDLLPEETDDGPIILGDYDPDAAQPIPRSTIQEHSEVPQPAVDSLTVDHDQPPKKDPNHLHSDQPPSLDSHQIIELDTPLAPEEKQALLVEALEAADSIETPDTLDELDKLPVVARDSFFEWGHHNKSTSSLSGTSQSEESAHTSKANLDETPTEQEALSKQAAAPDDDLELDNEEAQLEALDKELESIVGSVLETDTKALVKNDIQARIKRRSEAAEKARNQRRKSLGLQTKASSPTDALRPNKTTTKDNPASAEDESQNETPPSSDFFIDQKSDTLLGNSLMKRIKNSSPKWNIAAALLLVSTTLGVVFLQPDRLTHHGWFRGLSAAICSPLPCTPIFPIDIETLRVSGTIEPKPDISDVLTAKIEVLNRADYEQPFPRISLVFRDVRGQVSSSRIFQPSDYLRGQARTLKQMPINRAVLVEIDFLDPGERSVSYELNPLP